MPLDAIVQSEPVIRSDGPSAAERARSFDFRRPNKLSRDHLRNLQIIHETFAGQFSTLLSSSLRSVSALTVTSIEELAYDEYVRDIPIPTHLSILALEPLDGVGIFQLPIDGAMAIVELLLGGQGRGVVPDRPLSDIEASLIRTITDRGLRELAYAFESVIELSPRMIGTESNPQFAQLASPSDMVIVINFELRIGEIVATRVSLCYPYSTIKPLLADMVGHAGPRVGGDDTLVAAREQLAGRICEATVECSVQFEPTNMRSHEILGLRVGDIVNLSHPHDDLLTATVDGVPLFHVRPVRKGKRVAAQVVSNIHGSTLEN